MRYFIRLSFKGTRYGGWQIQQNAPSVQAELTRALSLLLGASVQVWGAGRTDSGVHAVNYVAHFDSNMDLSKDPALCLRKLNAILPTDICVHAITPVLEQAHARFDALSRTYLYYIHLYKNPFIEPFSTFCPFALDVEAMNLAANQLLGTHDFTSFAKLHGGNKTNICTLSQAFWSSPEPCLPLMGQEGHLVFTVSANRFLRNMVRAMVGTLIEVGRGKIPPLEISRILEAKNRNQAGASVSAQGLYLYKIDYPYTVF
ncbi:MAG: tRNA pseudouridine(38-40) synthase TruA [Bacteroidales bacterium]|nr:tRNA pseudouridine(38-40) synthase TruA [Bacteroidales bacterium]MCL2739394.1 tRNA pseudouridine(38-40) synthase TruA [Bacteroidales bacterium]